MEKIRKECEVKKMQEKVLSDKYLLFYITKYIALTFFRCWLTNNLFEKDY